MCTTDKRWGDQTVEELIHYPKRVFYMGRLDKDSEGLLLMTNNGEILNKMMRAGNYHEKEYLVRVNRPVTEAFLSGMAKGDIPVQEQQTRPCKVEKTGERTFRIILTQGLNRQIRRMCEYFGYQVVKLKNKPHFVPAEKGKVLVGKRCHVYVVHVVFSAARRVHSADNVQKGGFARAARTENDHEFTFVNG